MRGRKGRFLFTIFLVVLVFGLGTRIVDAAETVPVVRAEEDNTETALTQTDDEEDEISEQDIDILQEQVQNTLFAEFDFGEIEDSLKEMFPREKISFTEVVSTLMSGDMTETIRIFLRFLADQVSYEFEYNRRNLAYVLLAALTAAVFSNFAGAFKSRQISDISFYIVYMLLITLCLTSFQTSAAGLEEKVKIPHSSPIQTASGLKHLLVIANTNISHTPLK